MKATGFEIVEFFLSPWPDEYYVDDCELSVDEKGIYTEDSSGKIGYLPLDEKYDLSRLGGLCSTGGWDAKVPTLEAYFKKWKKETSTVTLHITVDKAREVEIRDALKALGVKVA